MRHVRVVQLHGLLARHGHRLAAVVRGLVAQHKVGAVHVFADSGHARCHGVNGGHSSGCGVVRDGFASQGEVEAPELAAKLVQVCGRSQRREGLRHWLPGRAPHRPAEGGALACEARVHRGRSSTGRRALPAPKHRSPAFLRARSSGSTTQPVVCASETVVLQSAAASPSEKCVRRSSALTNKGGGGRVAAPGRRRKGRGARLSRRGGRLIWARALPRRGAGGPAFAECASEALPARPRGLARRLAGPWPKGARWRQRLACTGGGRRCPLTLSDHLCAGALGLRVHDGRRGVVECGGVVGLERATVVAQGEIGATQVPAHLGWLGGRDSPRRSCGDSNTGPSRELRWWLEGSAESRGRRLRFCSTGRKRLSHTKASP